MEYDDRQHFTIQSAKALELYPPELLLRFDRQEWIKTCNSIKATDPNPNGYRLVRFRQGEFDWACEEAEERLAATVSATMLVTGSAQQSVEPAATQIGKIALVAHDYRVPDGLGLHDYSEHFARINKLCDDQGCDTVLYALYTWDSTSQVARTHDSMFDGMKHVRRIVLEVGRPPDSFDHVEIWVRGQQQPILARQRFATSSSPTNVQQRFLDDLPSRQIGNALLVICGETNIVKLKRPSRTFEDGFGFCTRLKDLKIRFILNPIHDYMTRYEMREKRRFYSRGGRTVVSVWNQGKGKEARLPWTVFHDAQERSDEVKEIERPFSNRPDIRIGVLNLEAL